MRLLILAVTCWMTVMWAGEAPPTRETIEAQAMSAISARPLNDGVLYNRWLADKGGGQRFGLWVPDTAGRPLRGILHSMHVAAEAERRDLQEWARAMDFAVLGVLARWAGNQWLYDHQLRAFGEAATRPELINIPLVQLGFSRNCTAQGKLSMALDGGAVRTLCLLWGGGPGGGLDFAKDEATRTFGMQVPILQINGDDDPFVENQKNLAWQRGVYPSLRALRLPFSTSLDQRTGHAWRRALALHIPFVHAMMAARYPRDADALRGRVALKPWTDEGFLLDPNDWSGTGALRYAKASAYQGSATGAVWVPDEATAQTWRSFVSRDTIIEPRAIRVQNGVQLSVNAAVAGGAVTWFNQGTVLGSSTVGDGALTTTAVATGAHSVWAVLPDGAITRPIVICNGSQVDQEAGLADSRKAILPINAVVVPTDVRATLSDMAARESSPAYDTWKLVFSEDFSKDKLDSAVWYEYNHLTPGAPANKSDATLTIIDGELEVHGSGQAIAMLHGTWGRRLAVEYRAKAIATPASATTCDLSVVVAGRPSGRFPWNQGAMFQFGGGNKKFGFNAVSQWVVNEAPSASTRSVVITPNAWHQVRVERDGALLSAWVDGVLASRYEMSDGQVDEMYSERVGFYTYATRARFDDIRIYARVASDPARIQPAMPDAQRLETAARALAGLLTSPWMDQRDSAARLLKSTLALHPALERMLRDKLDPRTQSAIEDIVHAAGRMPSPSR